MVREKAGSGADIHKILARAVAAGQTNEVIALTEGRSPVKQLRRLRKRLEASTVLSFDGGIVRSASGGTAPAIASWQGRVSITCGGHLYRYRLLALDRLQRRTLYAIPAALAHGNWQLPSIELCSSETVVLRATADEISSTNADRESIIMMPYPAKADIRQNRKHWNGTADPSALLALLQEQSWLMQVIAAALDTQLRSFKRFRDAPLGMYNFTMHGSDPQVDDTFCQALQALNFSMTADGFISATPPEIHVQTTGDLRIWRGCPDRLVLIRTATGSLLQPLLDEISDRERVRSLGGILPPRLPTVPIVRCKSVLCRPFVIDIELSGTRLLRGDEQDLLRSAMRQMLYRNIAQAMAEDWREEMRQPEAYRFDPFRVWQDVLTTHFLYTFTGKDKGLRRQARKLLVDTQAAQAAAEQARTETIGRALALLRAPDRFAREIIDRPDSKAAAVQQLDDEQTAVAFRFRPAKGEDSGMHFLAFTRASLLRLLIRVSCGTELLDALLDAAEKSGLLDQRKRTIKLKDETGQFITFRTEKF